MSKRWFQGPSIETCQLIECRIRSPITCECFSMERVLIPMQCQIKNLAISWLVLVFPRPDGCGNNPLSECRYGDDDCFTPSPKPTKDISKQPERVSHVFGHLRSRLKIQMLIGLRKGVIDETNQPCNNKKGDVNKCLITLVGAPYTLS